jgi:hypothetical protein
MLNVPGNDLRNKNAILAKNGFFYLWILVYLRFRPIDNNQFSK